MDKTHYKHIVFFKIHEGVEEAMVTKAFTILQLLGKGNPDILEWNIAYSLDDRKGVIIIEDSVFTSKEAFDEFRHSTQHADAAALMREIADWWVGDYVA